MKINPCVFLLLLIFVQGCSNDEPRFSDIFKINGDTILYCGEEHTLAEDDCIAFDKATGKLWVIKHEDNSSSFTEFKNESNSVTISHTDGRPALFDYNRGRGWDKRLYNRHIYNNLYAISYASNDTLSAMKNRTLVYSSETGFRENGEYHLSVYEQTYIVFDIAKQLSFLITTKKYKALIGIVEDEVFFCSILQNEYAVYAVNIYTLEERVVPVSLRNPGICAETKSIIGLNEKNKITVFSLEDETMTTYPIKGLCFDDYYEPTDGLYHYTGDYIYFAKRDFWNTLYALPALLVPVVSPRNIVKWYRYNIRTGKTERYKKAGNGYFVGIVED